jgi:hypothetical protein
VWQSYTHTGPDPDPPNPTNNNLKFSSALSITIMTRSSSCQHCPRPRTRRQKSLSTVGPLLDASLWGIDQFGLSTRTSRISRLYTSSYSCCTAAFSALPTIIQCIASNNSVRRLFTGVSGERDSLHTQWKSHKLCQESAHVRSQRTPRWYGAISSSEL